MGSSRLALGAAMRAAVIGALAFAAVAAGGARLYATTVVVVGIAVIIAVDLSRLLGTAERALARFVDGLLAEDYERPRAPAITPQLASAMERAHRKLDAQRIERERRLAFLESLVDTVAAALLVIEEADHVVIANRAARSTLGAQVGPLTATVRLGPEAVARIAAQPHGGRGIARLADGGSVLIQTAAFEAPGQPRRRLVSIQRVSGDLDAVEVKAQTDLVRVLAHEMMNSLTPICSLSESLLGRIATGGLAPDRRETAAAVEVIARRSAGLIAFVKRYRQVAQAPETEPTNLRVADIVERIVRLTAPMMAEAGVAFSSGVEPSDLTLHGDADLLEQALLNLLLNARDAVAGCADPTISLTGAREGDRIVLTVEDNGPGLPQADPEAAFVPFFTTKPGGSGIGLTIARQVAVAHGGWLDHAKPTDGGAAMRLTIPA